MGSSYETDMASLGSLDVSCVCKCVSFLLLRLSYEIRSQHHRTGAAAALKSWWAREAISDNGSGGRIVRVATVPGSVAYKSPEVTGEILWGWENRISHENDPSKKKNFDYSKCFLYSSSSHWAATAVRSSDSAGLKSSFLCPHHFSTSSHTWLKRKWEVSGFLFQIDLYVEATNDTWLSSVEKNGSIKIYII